MSSSAHSPASFVCAGVASGSRSSGRKPRARLSSGSRVAIPNRSSVGCVSVSSVVGFWWTSRCHLVSVGAVALILERCSSVGVRCVAVHITVRYAVRTRVDDVAIAIEDAGETGCHLRAAVSTAVRVGHRRPGLAISGHRSASVRPASV